ncbi:adenosine monophosphate-protein transferase SoFic [Kordia sp. SMS9]|uniref:Fic family protein n=1 Tax=Kordia sp. SMS9 TaxID=2282170 RepID=UPI000E0D4D8A|nr:Fic family protein [Kordia sp. SMS9]AXG68822.1 adenosine monophosphate-protein transferase SoFic [Kordia sp. SMS9]
MHQVNSLDKLPPKREKVETLNTLRQLSIASKSLGELKGIAQTMPNQEMLINAIVLQEAKDSSEIENIITTQDELYKALTIAQKQTPQVKEVINYRKAIFLGYDLLRKQGFLKLKDIELLQKTIIENDAGIRNMPGTVLKNDTTGEVVYTPPQEKQVILDLLGNFLEHFNLKQDNFPVLINLAILHYQFESIHPFYDGNGRTGRILNILYLIINNFLDIPILYLSSYINENKHDYYRLLNKVNKSDEWEEYILYILKAVEITANRTITKIASINASLSETIEIVKAKEPKVYKKELIELLFEQPYSKIEYVVKKLNVERKAASRYLNKLEKIGIVTSKKIGREKIYINIRLFEILKRN